MVPDGGLTRQAIPQPFMFTTPTPVLQRGLLSVITGTKAFLRPLFALPPIRAQSTARHGTYLFVLKLPPPFLIVRTLVLRRILVPVVGKFTLCGLTLTGRRQMVVSLTLPTAIGLFVGHLPKVNVVGVTKTSVTIVSVTRAPPTATKCTSLLKIMVT